MRRKVVAIVTMVAVFAAGGSALLATHGTNNKDSTYMTNSSSSSKNSNSAPSTTNSVTIENFAFSPGGITIKEGTTVTWTNKDSATHTVTETDGQTGPNSGNLSSGKTYSFTYDSVGTLKYHCAIHVSMNGTVTVT